MSGTAAGTLVGVILIFVVFAGSDPFPLVDKMWMSLIGVAVNVIVTVVAQLTCFKEDTAENEKDSLSFDKIKKIMKGVTEPIVKWKGALVWATYILTFVTALHWIDSVDDELVHEFGSDAVNDLMYNGKVRNVIAGLPDYIFASFMWYVVAIAVGIGATMIWGVNEVTATDDDMEKGDDGGILMEKVDTASVVAENNGQSETDILR